MQTVVCKLSLLLSTLLAGALPAFGSQDIAERPFEASPGSVLVVSDFVVPADSELVFASSVEIRASGVVRIEGVLRTVTDPAWPTGSDAPSIVLKSPVGIVVTGKIIGSRGRDGRMELRGPEDLDSRDRNGGRGSDIILDAPMCLIDGIVEAGDGGTGGPSAIGGRGGDFYATGNAVASPDAPTSASSYGGDGAGCAKRVDFQFRPGRPGRGGHAIVLGTVWDEGAWSALAAQLAPSSHREVADDRRLPTTNSLYVDCAGEPGQVGSGSSVVGGNGGQGDTGEPGSSTQTQGRPGKRGEQGGDGVGGPAPSGAPGRSCCPSDGQKGGKGGNAGKGTGGKGGKGGQGGDGYESSPGVYVGAKGVGGIGGRGGNGMSGKPGDGGKGGKKFGKGGDPGAPESPVAGNGGDGGDPAVNGTGNGQQGAPGGTGGTGSGGTASPGALGDDC